MAALCDCANYDHLIILKMLKKEILVKKNRIHRGKAIDFLADTVRVQNGKTAVREYTDHPGAAGALPVLPGNRVVLVRQYRYPVGKFTIEIPAGKLSRGEKPLACIKRELKEEAGLAAGKFILLSKYQPSAAFSTETIHVYAALNLKHTGAKPDDDEFIEKIEFDLDEAVQMVRKKKIGDSKTIIALLLWKDFLNGRES
ncbi:MAG: ADP-ribose pyrophosphatase [Elusimicrobia bacterium HGW-Elusimicrobia-2]|nr:MAG: ADP-ribose pyrophosphatase [Elusimicrobia bacterium HGW-Elusimicrobia-2]